MVILLVEDDDNKRRHISEFLREAFPDTQIEQAGSLQGGLRLLRSGKPNLVLLDMTLPNYDPGRDEPGGQPHLFGGREFLRQMDRFEISVPVIVITQFSAFGTGRHAKDLKGLDAELSADHAPNYRGSIYYNSAIHGWKDELRNKIDAVGGSTN